MTHLNSSPGLRVGRFPSTPAIAPLIEACTKSEWIYERGGGGDEMKVRSNTVVLFYEHLDTCRHVDEINKTINTSTAQSTEHTERVAKENS